MRLRPLRRRTLILGALAGAAIGVCLGGALAAPGWAQPRGDFRLWAEERQERWGPFGILREWEGSRVHGEGQFYPVNSGAWSVLVDASERGQELRFFGKDIPSSAGRVGVQLGDFVVQDPRLDPLRNEFEQAVWLRGAAVRLDRDRVGLGFRLGTPTRRQGLFGWGRQPLYGESFGATLSGTWRESGIWKADWDRQEAQAGVLSGRQVTSLFVGNQPAEGWSWLGQARLSHRDGSGAWAHSLLAGAGYAIPRFQASAHLRRIAPGFQGPGIYPDAHTDEWGGRLEMAYRPRTAVVVGTSWDLSRDLAPRPGQVNRGSRIASRFFASTPLNGPFTMHASVGYRNRSTDDPDSLLVDQHALFWSSALGWNSTRARAELSLTRSLFRDPFLAGDDWHENRFGAVYHQTLSSRLRADLRGWTVNRQFLDGRWASTEHKLESQWTWEPRPRLQTWIRLGRDFQEASDLAYARDQWELGVGWVQPLPWDFSFRMEGLVFARAGGYRTDRSRWSFRLARHFAFGGGRLGRTEGLPEYGRIRGTVYNDLNGDGRREDDEPGIPDMVLRLGSGAEIQTGPDGAYEFSEAATVLESVTLDVARLPTRYLAPAEPRVKVALGPGDEAAVDYPIRSAAGVVGRVVMNHLDHADGVPDVLIQVRDTHHDVFTDAEGRFFIPGLAPGRVTLEIIGWSLPKNAQPPEKMNRNVQLVGGRTVNAGVFVLGEKKPAVIQNFEGGSP